MTRHEGNLRKMRVTVDSTHTAQYHLPVGDDIIDMNAQIGKPVSVTYSQTINCVHCNAKTKKSFNQGYCYRCLISLAQCDTCIIKPELCHYHEGTCREPEWGEENCLNDHFVYLANTGTVKVGITRHVTDGVSSRWLDQGATQAIPMLRVKDRLTSGLVETACKAHVADKTNWRTMLKGQPEQVDLRALKADILENVAPALAEIRQQQGLQAVSDVESDPIDIHYPVVSYPAKITSINLDKQPVFEGVLTGIKGQYWLLDDNRVINMRKYAGYSVVVETQ